MKVTLAWNLCSIDPKFLPCLMRYHNFASDCVTRAHSAQNLTLTYRLLQHFDNLVLNLLKYADFFRGRLIQGSRGASKKNFWHHHHSIFYLLMFAKTDRRTSRRHGQRWPEPWRRRRWRQHRREERRIQELPPVPVVSAASQLSVAS